MSGYTPVDIEFQNLCYSVQDRYEKTGYKKILENLDGCFGSGNLTAILGTSGAGKSTLLNVLAGYISSGVTGSITVNNMPRKMKSFNKISTYIMQDDLVQPYLTVNESMMIVANLKLSSDVSQEEKRAVVKGVISMLGLDVCLDTRTENISGGQKKRLSIALELVNNPPVIFLDEPTTGLDNVASKHCIELLKSLARQGRTVICTIHQPSDSTFNFFDKVYFMANGRCTYNGPADNLISFLASAGFPCPTTYSPSDYIIELSQSNAKNVDILSSIAILGNAKKKCVTPDKVDFIDDETIHNFQIGFWRQFCILTNRSFLQISRNKTPVFIQLIHHLVSALLLGIMFYGIGNDANMAIVNFKFCLCVIIFFLYTHTLGPALVFPSESRILQREYFNRWYSFKAYYLSLTITPLPSMVIMGFVFVCIVYVMSDQPMDLQRFFYFTFASIFTGITSHGLGLSIGSILNAQTGACVAPAIVAPLAILGIYGMGYGENIHYIMKIVIQGTYVRYGLVGLCDAIYNDRGLLECTDEIYCYYTDPNRLMKAVGMEGTTYAAQVIGMMFFTILHRYLAYRLLKFKLNPENSTRLTNYGNRLLSYFR